MPGTEPEPAPDRGRRAAVAGRFVLFLALGAVVLSFGLVAGNGNAADHTPSFSDMASASARTEARSLAAEALVLATASKGGQAAELRAQAEGLRTQAALLTGTGREPAAAPTRGSSVEDLSGLQENRSSGAAQDTESERRNTERYVQALWESAETNLHSAWRADEARARLLAATGTAQRIWAQRVAALSGVELPGGTPSATGTADEELPGPDGSGNRSSSRVPDTCPANRSALPGTSEGSEATGAEATSAASPRPDTAAALTSVINAELGTAYAYQVALAQTEPAAALAGTWRGLATHHEAHGTDAVSYLADLCLPPVAPVAAYRLDPDFLRDPAGSLPALEEQFPGVYADLVALSDGELRGWAIDRFTAVSTDRYLKADSVPAAPGMDAVPDDLPWN